MLAATVPPHDDVPELCTANRVASAVSRLESLVRGEWDLQREQAFAGEARPAFVAAAEPSPAHERASTAEVRSTSAACEPLPLLDEASIAATCDVLLADGLFHDLSERERVALLAGLKSAQDRSTGAWCDRDGIPDLSTTAMAWWALAQHGEAQDSELMSRALRAVHELGGAQRAAFPVRLWLAMAGTVPWSWLPAVPSELWLLPASSALSPMRIAPWSRALLVAYHTLFRSRAHLHLVDASPLLLRSTGQQVIPPRLTRAGLAGDLLQVFDRAIKISRKVERPTLAKLANQRVRELLESSQQATGGWFSARVTVFSLLALRASGARHDELALQRGLTYLRRGRGLTASGEYLQAELSAPVQALAPLAAVGGKSGLELLLRAEIKVPGPWQRRANTAPAGWSHDLGASSHVDTWSTCAVIEALREDGDHRNDAARWPAMRRAAELLLSMQESDGSFARFERGERDVPLAWLPWRDADQLASAAGEPAVLISARVLAVLGDLGWRDEDDRIRRGLQFLDNALRQDGRAMHTATLAAILKAAAIHGAGAHPGLLERAEDVLRKRQGEDGSFARDIAATSLALQALARTGPTCVQAERSARWLVGQLDRMTDAQVLLVPGALRPSVGAATLGTEPRGGHRLAYLALREYCQATTR